MKHGEGNTKSPELLLFKFLPSTYHHSHFLATTLEFASFFTMAFLGAAHFLYTWAVLAIVLVILTFNLTANLKGCYNPYNGLSELDKNNP